MQKKSMFMITFASVVLSCHTWAATPAATVISIKGKLVKRSGDRSIPIRAGEKLEEGALLSTSADASVKLLFNDQSIVVLGPSTIMTVDSAHAGTPTIVTLHRGSSRATVVKAVAASDSHTRPKFFIRTKSATMGIRGTDLEAIYNQENKVTSLITFEGAVAMERTDAIAAIPFKPEEIMNGEKAVLILPGYFSSANPILPNLTIPTKLSPLQFESLKNADAAKPFAAQPTSAKGGAQIFSPIPPGVDPKAFAGTTPELDKRLAAMSGGKPMTEISPPGGMLPGMPAAPPPEGFYDQKTGAFAPPAGGFLDFKSGLYIPPPPGSAFDPNTGVFVPPPSFGKVDPASGGYVPPPGFNMDPNKGFVPVPGTSLPSGVPPPAGTMPPPGMPTAFAPGSMPAGMPVAGMGPGGMPPGMMPPGMMPPGMMPPGMMPPGTMPPGMGNNPFGTPPSFPVNDPFCPSCAPPVPPPPPPPPQGTTTNTVNFSVSVQ